MPHFIRVLKYRLLKYQYNQNLEAEAHCRWQIDQFQKARTKLSIAIDNMQKGK